MLHPFCDMLCHALLCCAVSGHIVMDFFQHLVLWRYADVLCYAVFCRVVIDFYSTLCSNGGCAALLCLWSQPRLLYLASQLTDQEGEPYSRGEQVISRGSRGTSYLSHSFSRFHSQSFAPSPLLSSPLPTLLLICTLSFSISHPHFFVLLLLLGSLLTLFFSLLFVTSFSHFHFFPTLGLCCLSALSFSHFAPSPSAPPPRSFA